MAVVPANRAGRPYPGGSVAIPPTGFPLCDIHAVASVVQAKRHLVVCGDDPEGRHVADRLVETYEPIVAA
jgi:hypothetical protein